MYVFMGIIAGILLSMQTAVNAKLRSYVKSPYASALISCAVSLVLILLLIVVRSIRGGLPSPGFADTSWWMFLGGFFGVFVLTGCIILFPLLGAVQTTILPIVGQILLGILADSFGWFGSSIKPFTLYTLAGLGLLSAGIICVVILPGRDLEQTKGSKKQPVNTSGKLFSQAAAILIGMASAAQAAVNGRLGSVLGSPLYASAISIATVVILAFLINIRLGTLRNLRVLSDRKAVAWAFPGGAFGVVFILLNTMAVPVIGTGSLMVLSVAGQLFCSVMIENYGWFYSLKRKIRPIQIIGLLLILAGVVIVKRF